MRCEIRNKTYDLHIPIVYVLVALWQVEKFMGMAIEKTRQRKWLDYYNCYFP